MLDIGWQELFIVGILAIIVIGPKDLPKAMRTAMLWVRKAKGLARDFQSGVDEMVREAELDDFKKEMNTIAQSDFEKSLKDAVDVDGDLKDDMDLTEVQKSLDKAAKEATKVEDKPVETLNTPESSPSASTETIVKSADTTDNNTDTTKQPASVTTASS